MEVEYTAGGSAILSVQEVDRTRARVGVTVNYGTTPPFATFRSMFVEEGNADVDHLQWTDVFGALHDDGILMFPGGEGADWFFHRETWSRHNTSAPDIRIRMG